MINIEQGNLIELLETDEIDFLIHQTNCFQTWLLIILPHYAILLLKGDSNENRTRIKI